MKVLGGTVHAGRFPSARHRSVFDTLRHMGAEPVLRFGSIHIKAPLALQECLVELGPPLSAEAEELWAAEQCVYPIYATEGGLLGLGAPPLRCDLAVHAVFSGTTLWMAPPGEVMRNMHHCSDAVDRAGYAKVGAYVGKCCAHEYAKRHHEEAMLAKRVVLSVDEPFHTQMVTAPGHIDTYGAFRKGSPIN